MLNTLNPRADALDTVLLYLAAAGLTRLRLIEEGSAVCRSCHDDDDDDDDDDDPLDMKRL